MWIRRLWTSGLLSPASRWAPHLVWLFSSVQFSLVAQFCPTLCDSKNCSMPGPPVHHQFPESTQTHIHRVGNALHPSHPLSSPSPPALNLSQHQGLFQWISSSHQVAKILELQLQHQYSGLIFFTIDLFDLLDIQGTPKSLQHHGLKVAILWCSAFFMV